MGSPTSSVLWVRGAETQLDLDVRKRREIHIRLVNVREEYPTGASPAHPGDPSTSQWSIEEDNSAAIHHFAPTAAIQQKLNDTFGKQANVWITVTEDPTPFIVRDASPLPIPIASSDGYITTEEADLPGHPIRVQADQNRADNVGFFTIFRGSRFAMQYSYSGPRLVIQQSGFVGKVNDIGHEFARFALMTWYASPTTYAHEIGHLLGLQHTWVNDPVTPYSETALPDDARRRVMCYDHYPGVHFLVKPERDRIHDTLDLFGRP